MTSTFTRRRRCRCGTFCENLVMPRFCTCYTLAATFSNYHVANPDNQRTDNGVAIRKISEWTPKLVVATWVHFITSLIAEGFWKLLDQFSFFCSWVFSTFVSNSAKYGRVKVGVNRARFWAITWKTWPTALDQKFSFLVIEKARQQAIRFFNAFPWETIRKLWATYSYQSQMSNISNSRSLANSWGN